MAQENGSKQRTSDDRLNISRHSRDIIQKHANTLFKDTALEFYGVKTAKIKELINVELPAINIAETSMDFVFLLEDDTYLHLEFQTTYNEDDLLRFAMYDLRLKKRDGRDVTTMIIYAAEIKKVKDKPLTNSLTYNPIRVMMCEYDGNTIYNELQEKINTDEELTDMDILKLIFLPLMNHTLPRVELAMNTVKMAVRIKDEAKRHACEAAAFAFGNRYLSKQDYDKMIGVLKMTTLADIMIGKELRRRDIEIVKNALKEGFSINDIVKITGLEESVVMEIKAEIERGLVLA